MGSHPAFIISPEFRARGAFRLALQSGYFGYTTPMSAMSGIPAELDERAEIGIHKPTGGWLMGAGRSFATSQALHPQHSGGDNLANGAPAGFDMTLIEFFCVANAFCCHAL
jgi:hypothetical protein